MNGETVVGARAGAKHADEAHEADENGVSGDLSAHLAGPAARSAEETSEGRRDRVEVAERVSGAARARVHSAAQRRVEAWAPWVAGLLLSSPVLVAYYPPMTDLPYHEAAIALLRHFGDATFAPPGLYIRNLGEPNQLFHMVGWALSYLVSTRWAVKLVVAATVVAIPVCAARLARYVGASPLAALLVAPMALGWLFSWGLVANLVGLAALLATLPVLDRFARAPTVKGAGAACLGAVLLYFAHEAMLFVYAGAALALAVLYPWSRRRTPLRFVPFVAGVIITVAQAKWQMRFMTPAVAAMPRLWHPIGHKILRIPYIILPATETPVQIGMLALCLLTLVVFFWLRADERRSAPREARTAAAWPIRARDWAIAWRWELFVVVCMVAYLAFPLTLNGATLVYQRWFPPGFAVLAVVAAPRDLWTRVGQIARIAVMTLPVATLLVAWPSFADSNREYSAIEPLFSLIQPGSAVADVDLGPADPSRTYSLGPAAGRILATRGGRLAYAFTDSPISPVVIPRQYLWSEALMRLGFDSFAFRPDQDLRRFRYVLVRVNDPQLEQLATFALAREATYLGESGEWVLFESRLPREGILSHDRRIVGPPSESLRDRIMAMLASAQQNDGQVTLPEPLKDEPEGAVPETY